MQKYSRTFHLSISPGATSDDKIMLNSDVLRKNPIVITEKMDGENTTIYSGGAYARSPDSRNHPSRDWLKAYAAGVSHSLSRNERIIGENLFAQHSISYNNLPSYFLGFAWIIDDEVQPWADTEKRFFELGIQTVPVLFKGNYNEHLFENMAASLNFDKQEGFVVRVASSFKETEMPTHVGKYVRPDHVTSDTHWMNAKIVPNGLAK